MSTKESTCLFSKRFDLVFIIILFSITTFVLSYEKYRWWEYVVHGLDFSLIMIVIFFLFDLSAFITQLATVSMASSVLYLRQLNKQIEICVRKYRYHCLNTRMFRISLFLFLKSHHSQIDLFQRANRDFWSRIMFLVTFSQLPVNVYMLADLFYSKPRPEIFTLMFLILAVQMFTYSLCSLVLAEASRTFHSPSRLFVPVQALIGQGSLRFKLKIMAYFERIHSINKIAFTIGPLGKITYESLFEVRIKRQTHFGANSLLFNRVSISI